MKLFKNFLKICCVSMATVPVIAQDYDGSDIAGIEAIVEKVSMSADWRKAADARIEEHRKSDLNISIIDADGNAVKDAGVSIQLTKHAFAFGAAIGAPVFDKTKGVIPQFFNQIGFHNALKYKQKERLSHLVQPIIDWAKSEDITVRGHNLIWPGWKFMPEESHKYKDGKDLKGLRVYAENQVAEYAAKWDVVEWDVINETRDNHDLQDMLGQDVIVDWFKIAKANLRNKDARLLLNENKVVSAHNRGKGNVQAFYDEVKYLLDNGAPINAIGVQSRYRNQDVSIDEMNKRLDKLAEFNLPIIATEFEVTDSWDRKTFIPSDKLRAEMTEEIMHTYFAHPSVDGIIAWNFLNRKDRNWGLINQDLSLPLNGKTWLYLTKKHWTTNASQQTDKKGLAHFRGFHGDYEVIVSKGETQKTYKMNLGAESKSIKLTIK